MSIKVLYLHHYASFGGASRSLLEMIRSFTKDEVEARVLTPRGQFAEMLRREDVAALECAGVSVFDNTRYGYYRGLRWVLLLREVAWSPTTMLSIVRARLRWRDIDIVHVNEATMLLSIVLARLLFRRPIVVHVRSVMKQGNRWTDRLLRWTLWRVASHIVAIDESVRRSLPADRQVDVVHNGLRVSRPSSDQKRASGKRFTVGMVGTLLLVKGCLDFIEAAALCKQRGLPIDFLLVGRSARRTSGLVFRIAKALGLSQEIEPEMRRKIAAHGLEDMVRFAGFSPDLAAVYGAMDVVCFPSHFDAPGRPIFEAALFSIPAIAAISHPLPDTIIDGVTGLTIPPQQPRRLADAIQRLYENADLREELGKNAYAHAVERFNARANAARMLGIYRHILGTASQLRPHEADYS